MALQLGARANGRRSSPALSTINTASSPNLSATHSAFLARKASFNALAERPISPSSPPVRHLSKMQESREIQVGDLVDVPGNMHGLVKFVGPVRGKKGIFAGVELSKDFASRGKNDGDVEGVRYFTTTVSGSGIFLPLHRAIRRASTSSATTDQPLTPKSPDYPQINTTAPKFSQSVGPGVKPSSPQFKPKSRQSLPRPESPLRKGPVLAPTSARPSFGAPSLSKSQIAPSRYTPSPVPARPSISSKTPQPNKFSRASSVTSGKANRTSVGTDQDITPTGTARSSDGSGVGSISSTSGFTPVTRRSVDDAQEEINRLKRQLEDRDQQLKDQASSLAEMESSLTELSNLMPEAGSVLHERNRSIAMVDDVESTSLRAIIREKNDKISMLISEFDNHRADFRSTIDTLELASTETQRVYELKVEELERVLGENERMLGENDQEHKKRVEELLGEIKELHDRIQDVETVSRDMKQLEEVVQELEEGLEDARRGQAEAQSEVEFLRGEVERTKSELERERTKQKIEGVGNGTLPQTRDIEQRDDEIRGLKAIIHSLSSGPDLNEGVKNRKIASNIDKSEVDRLHASIERLEREKKDLQTLVERKSAREEELQYEIEKIQRSSVISNAFSDKTVQENRFSGRDSKGTVVNWSDSKGDVKPLASMAEIESVSSTGGSATLWCEICETGGHDILTCSNIDGSKPITNGSGGNPIAPIGNPAAAATSTSTLVSSKHHFRNTPISSQDPDKPKALTLGKKNLPSHLGTVPNGPLPLPPTMPLSSPSSPPPTMAPPPIVSSSTTFDSLVVGKDGTRNANKWCAICEHDGHDSINCPLEDQF